jgi:hypothetical protein
MIERSMPAIPAPDQEMQRAIACLYKSLAQTALHCGLEEEFRNAMRGATRHRRDLPFRTRTLCLDVAYSFLGPALALKLLQNYRSPRMPSQTDRVD